MLTQQTCSYFKREKGKHTSNNNGKSHRNDRIKKEDSGIVTKCRRARTHNKFAIRMYADAPKTWQKVSL